MPVRENANWKRVRCACGFSAVHRRRATGKARCRSCGAVVRIGGAGNARLAEEEKVRG